MGADIPDPQNLVEALQQLRSERRVLRYKLSKTRAKFEKHIRKLRALEAEIAGLTHRVYESVPRGTGHTFPRLRTAQTGEGANPLACDADFASRERVGERARTRPYHSSGFTMQPEHAKGCFHRSVKRL